MRFTSEQIDVDDYHAAVELFFVRPANFLGSVSRRA